jgi:hypothetical protein
MVDREVVLNSILMELGGSPPVPPAEPRVVPSPMSRLLGVFRGNKKSTEEVEDMSDDGEEMDDKDDESEPVLDICQLLALLFIPFLRESNEGSGLHQRTTKRRSMLGNLDDKAFMEDETSKDKEELLGNVLEIALGNLIGEFQLGEGQTVHAQNNSIILTSKILRQILEAFGEFDVPNDVLEEMIQAAKETSTGGNREVEDSPDEVFLNQATFLNALTADTQLYDPFIIDHSCSTLFKDALVAHEMHQEGMYGKAKALTRRESHGSPLKPLSQDCLGHNDQKNGNPNALQFENVFSAGFIDNVADNYRSGECVPWVAMLFLLFPLLNVFPETEKGHGLSWCGYKLSFFGLPMRKVQAL